MFTPTIDLEVLNKATILHFSDVTGEDDGSGTAWDGVGGINSATVSSAILTITDPNTTTYSLDVTATINAAWPVTDDISFANITGEFADGYYTVVYDVHMVGVVFTAVADYSGTIVGTVLVTCAGHNLVTGMKVTIAGIIGTYNGTYDAVFVDVDHFYIVADWSVTDDGTATPYYSNTFYPFIYANVEMAITKMFAVFCNMDESIEGDEYLKQVDLLHGLLLALKSALLTTTTARVNNIYGRITRMLDFNNIELTYT